MGVIDGMIILQETWDILKALMITLFTLNNEISKS